MNGSNGTYIIVSFQNRYLFMLNYESMHASAQNEVVHTNAYKLIVCLAEIIKVEL